MDPHSRRSQFNHRAPKVGPVGRSTEPLPPSKPSDASKMPPRKPSATSSSTTTLIRRPIATNSRIKKDEMFKRDMYLSFVANALQQKSNGTSNTFDELVAQFNVFSSTQNQSEPVDTAQIRLWLLALSHVVSRLERTHSALVDAIVNMPWTTLDNNTVKSYTVFIGMLLSARPEYLSLVLAKIALGFTYQSGIQALDASLPSTSSAPLTRRIVYDRLHYLLRHILALVPTLPSTLQPLLVRHFPHKRQNQVAQTTYIRNLLRVSSYCPELADKVLATIIDRAIQIDVEIQIELEELEEEADEADEQEVFELDPFDFVLGQEPEEHGSDSEDEDEDDAFSDLSSEAEDDYDVKRPVELPTNVRHIQEMVKKLDAILLLLFEHFDQTKTQNSITPELSFMSPPELPPLPPLERSFLDFAPPYTQDVQKSSHLSTPPPALCTPSPQTPSAPTKQAAGAKALRSQFHALLSIFDRTILRTFKSRYTQFLVFWYASLDAEFADVFQGMLVDRALMASAPPLHAVQSLGDEAQRKEEDAASQQPMTPELTRAAAASYIGSFVSRATFVDRTGARRVVGVLCEYLRTHLEGVEADLRAGLGFGAPGGGSSSSAANTAATVGAILASGQHTVFYAVAQAVFLIFCFRWRDLEGDEDEDELDLDLDLDIGAGAARDAPRRQGGTRTASASRGRAKDNWMPELAVLKRIVSSILNPLKVCSSNVVMQFARVAQATDFIYCYTILESNKRLDTSASTSTSSTSSSAASKPNLSSSTSSLPRETPSASSLARLLHSKALYAPPHAELNTFFPFDPYRLPKSGAFIQGVYREWASVAIDGDEDEDEAEGSDDEGYVGNDSSDAGERAPTSRYLDIPKDKSAPQKSEDDGGLGASLGAMSISPARMSISVDMMGR